MDYKYIEQLLDRYFDCLTTLDEEQILRSFFGQEDVPAHLMQYRDLFVFQTETKKDELDEEFDARMLKLIDDETASKPNIINICRHMAPLFRAAAIVAVILSVGNIAEHSISTVPVSKDASSMAIDPYIKSADINSAVHIKDVNRAEVTTPDSMLSMPVKSETDGTMQ